MSPTCDAVVYKTLEMTSQIAENCCTLDISVSYDLAIANRAYKIQAEAAPKFDKIFIHIGAFHIQLSFFKVIGKYIEGSGIPALLQQAGLIAEGSLNGIISGKKF